MLWNGVSIMSKQVGSRNRKSLLWYGAFDSFDKLDASDAVLHRHLVGKTLINLCCCDILYIRLTVDVTFIHPLELRTSTALRVNGFYRAMLCIRGTSHGPVSVRLSVTSRSSTKTAKRRITQTTPHDSPGTLVCWSQRSPRNSTGVTPYGGAKCRWGGSKSATFDK